MRTLLPLVGLALSMLAACGGSSDASTGLRAGPNLDGKYTLTSVDNQTLPVAFADSTLESGELVVADSGWTQTSVVQYAAGGSADGDTLKLAGYWVANGTNLILFDYSNSTTYTGSYTSTAITLTTKTATVLTYSK